jgi:hypothetical protein
MQTKNITTVPYRVARAPIALLDRTVMTRFADDSSARIAFDRAVGSLDVVAGRVLRNDDLAGQGAQRIDRARKLARATELETHAAQQRSKADEVEREGAKTASAKRDEAQQRAAEGLSEAARTEAAGKQAAAQHAREQAAQAKQHAAARGNRKLSTIRQGLKQTEAVAEAREHLAEDKAKAEVSAATKQKAAARRRRKDADELGDLATQKRRQRASSSAKV